MAAPPPAELAAALAEIVGGARVSTRGDDRATYARDMWPRLLLGVRAGQPAAHPPDAIVWPETEAEIVAIVQLCRRLGVPIVPYGGGSGVAGGAVPVRGGVTIDTKRMAAIEAIDDDALTVTAQAGINGERLERALDARGLTLGHFPSSIYCSTLGGWLAARSGGQMSSRYGKIEDMVRGLRMVTGRGEVVELGARGRAGAGPDWLGVALGAEGTLGVITQARLRVWPRPAVRHLRGLTFPDVPSALAAVRRLLQRELVPAVVRLYDELDSLMHLVPSGGGHRDAPAQAGGLPSLGGPAARGTGLPGVLGRALGDDRGPRLVQSVLRGALARPRVLNAFTDKLLPRVIGRRCLLIVGTEGARPRADLEAELVLAELVAAGGTDLGPSPGERWYAHRYAVSYNMSKIFEAGAFVDTMEVATTWDRLAGLYDDVRNAIGRHAFVMAHFSHAYPEGCSIYFTFVGSASEPAAEERLYDTIWREALAAATSAGGTISHHHGVGLLKAPAMRAEHGPAMAVLDAAKRAFDPDGIMNPGKLGLSEPRRPRGAR